jgi:hypothetical protein
MEKVRQNGETFVDANREHLERVLSDFEPVPSNKFPGCGAPAQAASSIPSAMAVRRM